MANTETKICLACNEEKALTKFYKQGSDPACPTGDGRRWICMGCTRKGWVEPNSVAELEAFNNPPEEEEPTCEGQAMGTVVDTNQSADDGSEPTISLGRGKTEKVVEVTPAADGEKVCKHCGTAKPLSDFYNCKTNNDGLSRWCKPCNKEYAKARREAKAAA